MIQQAKLGVYRTNIPWLRGRWDETCSDDDAATVALRVKLRFPGKCTRDNFGRVYTTSLNPAPCRYMAKQRILKIDGTSSIRATDRIQRVPTAGARAIVTP